MIRLKWLLLVLICIFLAVVVLYLRLEGHHSAPHQRIECAVKPFRDFAYLPDEATPPIPVVLPGPPWQIEAVIPGREGKPYHDFTDFQLMLARTKNGEQEIWLHKAPDYRSGSLISETAFLIYRPASQTWEEISAKIGDTNLDVKDLFITNDGTLWGGIWWSQDPPYPMKAPVLGKFDESNRRFESAAGGLEISLADAEGGVITTPTIMLDKEDIFWLFVRQDGIYHYDPKTGVLDKRADLPDTKTYAIHTALSSDDSIYFQMYPTHSKEFLFQFSPITGEILPVKVPDESWSKHAGMLVDSKGRLWLGAMGYLDTNGHWRLIHPHPRENFEHSGPLWTPPTLIFESSNGLLWYAEYQDMERRGEGTAWYDPETGEGCLFTNLASYIVEDSEKQLWMVADGKLYRYQLEQ